MKPLLAGSAIIDVTPQKPMFLHGYPHVERISEGTHDPLYASALILDNGETQIGFCAVDVIFVSKDLTTRVREKVEKTIGLPGSNLMISASHTHSGPVTVSDIFCDPVVPKADPEYISWLVERLVDVVIAAFRNKQLSEIAVTTADGTGVGGNRRSKTDAIDSEVAVMVLRAAKSGRISCISTTYCMHPTVLHEDSKLYSADFPGYTRQCIDSELGSDIVLLYANGPCGNQSTRHFIKSNSFDEAQRMGYLLGERIVNAVKQLGDHDYKSWVPLSVSHSDIMLPGKEFMSLDEAEKKEIAARNRLAAMRDGKASASEIRTAEVDLFGAEENKQLAAMAANGELDEVYRAVLPIEIDVIKIGAFRFVYLPGELFVEFSLMIKEAAPAKTFVVAFANGVLSGYIVTAEAEEEGGYEASNSIFPASAGTLIIEETLRLLNIMDTEMDFTENWR